MVRPLLKRSAMTPMFGLLLIPAFTLFGNHGSGKVVVEQRKAGHFEKVAVGGALKVIIEIDDERTVSVETDDNLQRFVTTEVKSGTLHVKTAEDVDATKLVVRITTPELVAFDSRGATQTEIRGIDCDRFELDVSGAAEVELSGEVEVFVIDASGAAKIRAEKLIAERVEVAGRGASDFVVHASDALIAKLSGAGDLSYAGDPDEVKTDLSGVASVRRR